jgi:hypothetical protein
MNWWENQAVVENLSERFVGNLKPVNFVLPAL